MYLVGLDLCVQRVLDLKEAKDRRAAELKAAAEAKEAAASASAPPVSASAAVADHDAAVNAVSGGEEHAVPSAADVSNSSGASSKRASPHPQQPARAYMLSDDGAPGMSPSRTHFCVRCTSVHNVYME